LGYLVMSQFFQIQLGTANDSRYATRNRFTGRLEPRMRTLLICTTAFGMGLIGPRIALGFHCSTALLGRGLPAGFRRAQDRTSAPSVASLSLAPKELGCSTFSWQTWGRRGI